jgi:hypothetical protein
VAALSELEQDLEGRTMKKIFEIYTKTTPELLTWEIEPVGDSCLLKVTHDQAARRRQHS